MLTLAPAFLGTPRCLLSDEPSIGLASNLAERLLARPFEIYRVPGAGAVLVEQKAPPRSRPPQEEVRRANVRNFFRRRSFGRMNYR
ncbi:MAG: hypothetical protein M0002_07170 [Rhodospirillales bacterium]|nr:hypothetical protein [Rhodospirillales bacterium]